MSSRGCAAKACRPRFQGGRDHELSAYRHSTGGADRPLHGSRLSDRRRERRRDRAYHRRRHEPCELLECRQARAGDARRHEVDESTAPDLVHLVQDLARSAGLPMPRVYLMDNPQPNAFATGRNPEHAAVAVTTGLLQMLSREEVAGVIAHELAHMRNRDTLTMTITATIAGAISMLAQFGLFFGGGSRDSNSGLGVIGTLLMVIVAPLAAMIVQ